MIHAHLVNNQDGTSLGEWKFGTLPRIGEIVTLRADDIQPYGVVSVEHWPTEHGLDPADVIIPMEHRIIIRVAAAGMPY